MQKNNKLDGNNLPKGDALSLTTSASLNLPKGDALSLPTSASLNLPKGDALSLPTSASLNLPKGDALSLPKGWEMKKLGQLCEVIAGQSPQSKYYNNNGKGLPFYQGKKEFTNKFIGAPTKWTTKITKEAIKDDILISVRAPVGPVNFSTQKICIGRGLAAIRASKRICIEFLFFFLLKHENEIIGNSGAVFNSLNKTQIGAIEIPLPPLPEQQRIVGKLDALFAGIEALETNTKQNLENAKELFQSYLQAVFDPSTHRDDDCGALSSSKWEERTLKEVTSKIGSGATPRGGKASYKEKGISLIRSMNVHDFEFKEKKLAFIDEQQAEALSNVELQEKDVLMNITGASIARCCIVPNQYLPARVNQHVSIIRAKQNLVSPLFLASLLTSKPYKDQILETGGQGATRQAITKAQLESFKITIPKTVEEQQRIVAKLDALSTETKKLESIYQEKLLFLSELKKSILDRAFKGKLL